MKAPPRVVLDTNVVLSALLFGGGNALRVRSGWQAGLFVPLASQATTAELLRVLSYPKFRLSPAEQEELLADYIPWVQVVRIPDPPPAVPACRDAFDLPFMHLAVTGKARWLVTGDKDLLSVEASAAPFRIITLETFCREVMVP